MKALQLLADLDYNHKRDLYPSIPEYAIKRTRFNDRTANGLTRSILRWMELKGHYATRITTTGRQLQGSNITDVLGRVRITPGKWIPGTTRKGTADIHAVVSGRHCSIEVKIGYDRLSPEQVQTKQDVERSGGCFVIAKDFESFMIWYQLETQ